MPPPGLLAAPRSGGTTSPSKSELIGAARVILDNCGVQFSQNKIVRLVLQFLDRAPRANGHAFFLIKARIDRDTRETFVMGEAEDAIDSDPAPEVLR